MHGSRLNPKALEALCISITPQEMTSSPFHKEAIASEEACGDPRPTTGPSIVIPYIQSSVTKRDTNAALYGYGRKPVHEASTRQQRIKRQERMIPYPFCTEAEARLLSGKTALSKALGQ
ncbi:hypothetical protein MBM_00953 [Drepanopeziza brunnea f. sp. 'multigermtubi' MB_m1]|uniref:Uncharacterized protein n=1 Tax=Marssonina brunnea f. sp. multigermtubi (strain MB_m1) TaxID=1072389 RepID=K1X528_MARBU|nr:uncharacterized protein MBM_00953 [Drepanopeziza brunnea f. sp. 'multigermtubi' MB_m1]EKD20271.1 hypothetical protein MBM_00953 [Drepanopeziza brunnea f. sp. 'multigermtubi' MB_m1]